MAPAFLNNIAAPQLHASFLDLIKLWSEKTRLANGHPFSAKEDIHNTALEAIYAAVFDNHGKETITRNEIELLSRQQSRELPPSADEAIEWGRAPVPLLYDTVLKLTDSLEAVMKSPFPRVLGFMRRHFSPSHRQKLSKKDRLVAEEIAKAEKRMSEIKGDAGKMTNAVDHMLHREQLAAGKLNRTPDYHSKVMIAEVNC
jgi:hypothetical protein